MQALFTNPSTGEKVSFLYQWETDIDFSFEAKNGTNVEVAFSTMGMKEAIRKDCTNTSGDIWTCKIPDTILQYGTNVAAYITYISGNSVRVVDRADITVKKRKKPAGYVSTTDDTWITVEQMLERIEASTNNIEAVEKNVKSSETEVKKVKEEVDGKINDFSTGFENYVRDFELLHQQAVADVNNAGQAQTERVEEAGDKAVNNINAAGTTQINAINSAGEQQIKAVEDAGSAQVSAVQKAAAEIIADREQIAELRQDLTAEQTAREQVDTSLQHEISGKLPKSPADWEQWTAEEQAAARERLGLDNTMRKVFSQTETEWAEITALTVDVENLSHIAIFIQVQSNVQSMVSNYGLISLLKENGKYDYGVFEIGNLAESTRANNMVAYARYDINDFPVMARWGEAGGNPAFSVRGGKISSITNSIEGIPGYKVSQIIFPPMKGIISISVWGC